MAEPFKNMFNITLVRDMAQHFERHNPQFNSAAFITDATSNFDSLELKERSNQIALAMHRHLSNDFNETATLLLQSLDKNPADDLKDAAITENGIAGWAIMPMAHYVSLYGVNHFETSMQLLKEFTKRFTSEFAIRSFLLQNQERALYYIFEWAQDENRHVRRLASEGSRPRLPWAEQLPELVADPTPLLDLLDMLKDDPEPYVRKSVANSLNDISKDHPELVTSIASDWFSADASPERHRLVKHGCRTLIKQGNKQLLTVLGYGEPNLKVNALKHPSRVHFGEALPFTLSLTSTSTKKQPLIIDYIIHHQKSAGHTTPKVFKWKTTTLGAQKTIELSKNHPFKKITTRVYYPGEHKLEIMINGQSFLTASFELCM